MRLNCFDFAFQLQHGNERVTLLIPEAHPKDAGTYILCAKNTVGLAYTSCTASVKGRVPNDFTDSEMVVDTEPIQPTVQLPLKDLVITEGQSVQLDCVITGQPEPEVIWYHEGRPVKESADVQLLFRDDRCTLVIQEAVPEDVGEYKVVAINSAGEASSKCQLTVNGVTNGAQPLPSINDVECVAPRFEKLLCDILANVGETIEFECAVTGVPWPMIKWFLNNTEIHENDRIQFVQNSDDGQVKLVLKNVSSDDKGVYTVKATNVSGEAKCFSHLIVKTVNAPENLMLQNNFHAANEVDEKHTCPTFKEKFGDKVVDIDDTVKFECIIVGKPTPKIKWFYNDRPVQGRNFLTSISGDRQVLTVPAVTHESVGKIACSAENEFGKATCIAYLNLIGDAAPPSSEQCQRYIEEYNTESSNVTIKKQTMTTTRTSQISSYQSENGGVLQPIIQRSEDLPKVGSIFGTSQFNEFNKSTTALNHSGEITQNGHSTELVLKSTRKNMAPRFISPLIGKILDQGSDTVLEAIIDGHPIPQIVLTKNGELLIERNNVTVTQHGNKIVIELRSVTIADAGRYSISATNSMGNAVSTADIVVKSEYGFRSFELKCDDSTKESWRIS